MVVLGRHSRLVVREKGIQKYNKKAEEKKSRWSFGIKKQGEVLTLIWHGKQAERQRERILWSFGPLEQKDRETASMAFQQAQQAEGQRERSIQSFGTRDAKVMSRWLIGTKNKERYQWMF